MSLEADLIVDRARLKRRLTRWRIGAIAALGVAVFLALGLDGAGLSRPHVARLAVSGLITDDRAVTEALGKLATDDAARALIVAIDSPGGTVAGGEALFAAIGRVAETKPVVAVMGGTAASAGYMAALPASRLFAREGTLTGSIGVVMQTFEASRLLDQLGIGAEALTSGALKGQPSPFRPLTDEGRAVLGTIISDLHGQFVQRVAAARRMDEASVRALADGRAMTGRQALAAGLIDAIGGEAEARLWLAAEHQVPASLPVRRIAEPDRVQSLLSGAVGAAHRALVGEWLRLDLPLAVWQPR